MWTGAGAIASAAVFSACCWVPLLAVAVGVSAGGAAAALERYRWIFLLAALAFLTLGFYLNERRLEACAPDGTCPEPRPGLRRFNRVVLVISTLFVALVAAFPNYVGHLASSMAQTNGPGTTLTIPVQGMTCVGCETSVESALRSVRGVSSVEADYDRGLATLRYSSESPPAQSALSSALNSAGYRLGNAKASKSNFEGRWKGRLPVSTEKTVPWFVDLGRLGDRWIGEVDVEAQGVKNHPLGVSVADSILHLTLRRGVTFSGRLSPGGESVVGELLHGDDRSQLALTRDGGAQFSKALLRFEQSAAGIAPLIQLSADGSELRRDFNHERSKVRLVLLLSPT